MRIPWESREAFSKVDFSLLALNTFPRNRIVAARPFCLLSLVSTSCSESIASDPYSTRFLQASRTEFGQMYAGVTYPVDVTIRNPLKEDLYVFEVVTSCGCMASGFRSGELKAGEAKEFDVAISAKAERGPWKESLRVFSTSDQLNETVVVFSGNVIEGPIVQNPAKFDRFVSERGGETTLTLSWPPGLPRDILDLEWHYSESFPAVSILESITELQGDTVTMPLAVEPSSFRGLFSGYLQCSLRTERRALLKIPVSGAAVSMLAIRPQFVTRQSLRNEPAVSILVFRDHLPNEDSDVAFIRWNGRVKGLDWTLRRHEPDQASTSFAEIILTPRSKELPSAMHIPFVYEEETFNISVPIVE